MISAHQLAAAFGAWLQERPDVEALSVPLWRKERNSWMREQGIGGIMKEGKHSKSIPPWWGSDSEFWFKEQGDEDRFAKKYLGR